MLSLIVSTTQRAASLLCRQSCKDISFWEAALLPLRFFSIFIHVTLHCHVKGVGVCTCCSKAEQHRLRASLM